MLNSIRKSIQSFPTISMPSPIYLERHRSRLILEETSYDTHEMYDKHRNFFAQMNAENQVYDAILECVYSETGGIFFVYGSGGCGKIFLWNTIISRLRSEKKIVLPVASSGIAATLLPGGRTTHSQFKIPLKLDETSMCSIKHNYDIAEFLKKMSLIIWDEAPMQGRYTFESLDRTLRDIMNSVSVERFDKPFGGITMVMGGDFRQILLVIPKGERGDIVSVCIISSPLWYKCKLFKLLTNMRLNEGTSDIEKVRRNFFCKWVLDVGDGKVCKSGDALDDGTSQSMFRLNFLSYLILPQ